uniref:Uncharacterized protein n=1 Tax=viral metagenome TaxID=1070528 RepID=A0A6H1Z9Z0_9ZZZZ
MRKVTHLIGGVNACPKERALCRSGEMPDASVRQVMEATASNMNRQIAIESCSPVITKGVDAYE